MLISASILVGLALLPAQTQGVRLGLSRDEVLAMSAEQWIAFYSQKTGRSDDAAVDSASTVYAECLRSANEEKMARLQTSDRDRVQKYRKLADQWRTACIEIANGYAGADNVHAEPRSRVALEEMISTLIDLNSKPIADGTLDRLLNIQDMIGKIRRTLGDKARISQEERLRMPSRGIDPKRIDAACAKAGKAYDVTANLLPRERQEECLTVLDAFYEWLTKPF